jgi:hypothetical protein
MFVLPEFEGHGLSCTCCVGGVRSAMLLPIYSTLMELDAEIALRAMKEDGEDQTDGESVSADDPFYKDELAIAALLAALYLQKTDEVKPALDAALTGTYDATKVNTALSNAANVMAKVVTGNDGQKIRTAVDTVITNGAKATRGGGSATGAGIVQHVGPATVAKGTIIEDSPSAKAVLDGIVDATGYYTNTYFNTQVVPAIQRDIQALLDDHTGLHKPDLTPIRDALNKRLVSVPYWRLVANVAASRGFHYGLLKAGSMTGQTGYTWVAIIDEKTSQICISLNGRNFLVGDAVALLERAANAQPGDVKKILPWPTRAQTKAIPNMTNAQLRDAGFMVPPAHGHCRSTIRLYSR